jgi:hypothetical protein
MIYISAIEIIPFNIYLFLENIYFQITVSIIFTLEKRKNKSSMIIYLNNIIKIIKID